MNYKIYSFFSGAGFLDLGFEKSGFQITFVNEFNKVFLDVYKYARNKMELSCPKFGYYNTDIDCFLRGNSKKKLAAYINEDKKDSLVGFIGGPPCPDFSIAGKKRRNIWR